MKARDRQAGAFVHALKPADVIRRTAKLDTIQYQLSRTGTLFDKFHHATKRYRNSADTDTISADAISRDGEGKARKGRSPRSFDRKRNARQGIDRRRRISAKHGRSAAA